VLRRPPEFAHLDWDEICHYDDTATRWRHLKSGPVGTQGRLLLTNKRLRFIAEQNAVEAAWARILSVSWTDSTVDLSSSRSTLNTSFGTPDPEWVHTIVEALIKIDRRQIVGAGGQRRPIPQSVKAAVWQRDGGRCAECGSTVHLEFDHIIPVARGGADTERNLQLLCLDCNRRKSARI
jgi:5-methylcytosine-specific restriction endonuclease McrA